MKGKYKKCRLQLKKGVEAIWKCPQTLIDKGDEGRYENRNYRLRLNIRMGKDKSEWLVLFCIWRCSYDKWKTFLKKKKTMMDVSFEEGINLLRTLLMLIVQSMGTGNEFSGRWSFDDKIIRTTQFWKSL